MENQKNSNNFMAQAGILAIAGMISRIIGLLYTSPLNAVVGELGLGLYSSAYGFYTIVLLVSSYSIPAAISKVIAGKLAVKQYRNAHRFFYGALAYVLVVGSVAGLFLYFGAGLFVEESAIPVLRTFAPTIFVYGILGVLRGYFQAHRSMVQTSVSQILEQIVNAVVSVGGATLLIYISMGALQMPADSELVMKRATFGAVGGALGTGSGVFAGLLFMLGIYCLNRKMILKRVERDRHEEIDSYFSIFRSITMVVTPFILSTAVYNLSAAANNYIYNKAVPGILQLDTAGQRYFDWGIFAGQSMKVANIPIAFATAMATAMLPAVASMIAANQIDEVKEKIQIAIKTTMIISIPCAAGLFALARPVMYFLFGRGENVLDLSSKLLMVLSVSVIFYALSTLSSQILQGLGKLNAPIINAAIALVAQTVLAIVLLVFTNLDLYAMAIVNTFYAAIMCVLNQWSVRKAVGYKQEVVKSFLVPLLCSVLMGAASYGTYTLLHFLTKSMRIALIPAVLVGMVVYFVLILLLKGMDESEIRGLPKGYLIVKMAKKCRLLR